MYRIIIIEAICICFMLFLFILLHVQRMVTQVRIAEGDNTAQYWPNIGSQESAIVIRPGSLFASVKCWSDAGGLFRMFKFTDLQLKLGPVSALYQVDCNFYCGIQI